MSQNLIEHLITGNVSWNTVEKLSKRELSVLFELKKGHSNAIIGSTLRISPKTVKFHLTNIYKKLNVKSRLELLVKLT